ncbi:hypothetical protein AVEN_140579-1 [Araneus ventricosus]|uniref:Uncharacterized protein n=1 Tax=Araneus ventricosus TaxID=182803 RepID=A0A4Y2KY25_ARAVE|nr:hypothetical protein AVEN_140579-1 [Araneus ventricosus]
MLTTKYENILSTISKYSRLAQEIFEKIQNGTIDLRKNEHTAARAKLQNEVRRRRISESKEISSTHFTSLDNNQEVYFDPLVGLGHFCPCSIH